MAKFYDHKKDGPYMTNLSSESDGRMRLTATSIPHQFAFKISPNEEGESVLVWLVVLASELRRQRDREILGGNNNERLERLEELVGEPTSDLPMPVFERMDHLHGGMVTLETSLNSLSGATEESFKNLLDNLNLNVEKLRSHQENLVSGIKILKKALAASSFRGDECSRVKIPKSLTFDCSRDAKALQNFIFNVEQYFAATRIPVDEQGSITFMYLTGDVKLS